MDLNSQQIEVLFAIIKVKGLPSTKADWQQVADYLSDKPISETARSRWRSLEKKLKKHSEGGDAGEGDGDGAVDGGGELKKPTAGAKKKKTTGEPAAKKPRVKKAIKSTEIVQDDNSEEADDENGDDGKMLLHAGSKRKA